MHAVFVLLRSSAGLTWHQGAIPSNELWVKLGGDKGHGSFKLNLQLVNTANPNLLSIFPHSTDLSFAAYSFIQHSEP